MKVLVTGAAGFVGTNITLELLKKGFEVVTIDSLIRPGSEKNLEMLKKEFPNLNFIRKEIEDVPGVIANEKPDLIYHFAAQVG
ncbi:MAG: GDP-mannose 4,6-dehydratase, partial [Nanoarchaeota archaeon]